MTSQNIVINKKLAEEFLMELQTVRSFIDNLETKFKTIFNSAINIENIIENENIEISNPIINENGEVSYDDHVLYNLIDTEAEEIEEVCTNFENMQINEDNDEQSTQSYVVEEEVEEVQVVVEVQQEVVVQQEEEEVQQEEEVIQQEEVQQEELEVQQVQAPVERRGRKKKNNPPIDSIQNLEHENQLKDYNAKDLRTFLKSKKLSTNGKKFELMLRVFKCIMHPNQLTDEDKPKKKGRKNRNNNEANNVIVEHSLQQDMF